MTYSYHIFYFPFKWEIRGFEDKLFSEQVDLNNIDYSECSEWERTPKMSFEEEQSLYNEKNYYYKFVHHILYDDLSDPTSDLIRHFERKEPKNGNVFYHIKKKDKSLYELKVDAINLNLYSTGVGFLSFYLKNESELQSKPEDILFINQYGRRIMPPFYKDIELRSEIAQYISIIGLNGGELKYKEDFNNYSPADSWKPALFIRSLITDLTTNVCIEPIVDDRMFIASWCKSDELAASFSVDTAHLNKFLGKDEKSNDFWYRYLFVDGSDLTCQNDEMQKRLLEKHTYTRWQKYSSLYGISKYSLVYLTYHKVPAFLLDNFQTSYARMVELVLVQRASMLRFSGEITKVSKLANQDTEVISKRISSLYREYIRFVNQIYFREVTAQDQGTEMYEMLQSCLKMEDYIKDLDGEMEELHQYVSLMEDRGRNKKAAFLNNIAMFFLPITVITGFWGMNKVSDLVDKCPESTFGLSLQLGMIAIGVLCACLIIYTRRKKI